MNKRKDIINFIIAFLLASLIVFYIIAVTRVPQHDFEKIFKVVPRGISFFGKEYLISESATRYLDFFDTKRNEFYDIIIYPPLRELIKKSAASLYNAAEQVVIGINDIVVFAIHGNM